MKLQCDAIIQDYYNATAIIETHVDREKKIKIETSNGKQKHKTIIYLEGVHCK